MNSSIDSSVGVESSVMFEPTSTFEAPSTSQFTALRRAPAIEIETLLVRPIPTSSGSDELTPGTSVASCTKLRLLSGSDCTCTGRISHCTAGVACTSPEAVDTSTLVSSPRTFSRALIVMRSFTCTPTPRATCGWNPGSE